MSRKNAANISLALLLLMVMNPRAMAGENECEIGTFLSHYVWRGLRLSQGPVYQTSLTLEKNGFSFSTWGNYDIDDGKLNEIDLTFAYSRELELANIEVGWIHYGLFDDQDTDELYASVAANCPLSPSVTAYFDVNAGKGAVIQAAVEHTLNLTSKASLNLKATATAVINDGVVGLLSSGKEYSGLHNAELLASLPIELSSQWSLRLQGGVSVPLSENARDAIRSGSVWKPDESSFHTTFLYGGVSVFYTF